MSVRSSKHITAEIKNRIRETALKNPECGPRRLARLLKRDGIIVSASTIYRVLRTDGLHTTEKRLEQAVIMKSEPTIFSTITQPPAEQKPSSATLPSDRQPVFEKLLPSKPARRGPSIRMSGPLSRGLRIFKGALVILAVSLGIYAALQFKAIPQESDTIAAALPADDLQATPVRQTGLLSIHDYRAIWKRDLFGTAAKDKSRQQKVPAIENIPRVSEDLGLKLVGTAAAEISSVSIAVIVNSKTRSQEPFREGDRIGDLRIKKILRTSVVLITDAGEVLLAMGDGSGGTARNDAGVAMADANRTYAIEITKDG